MNLRDRLATEVEFKINDDVCWLDGKDDLFTGTIVQVDTTNKWYVVRCDQYAGLQLDVCFVCYDRNNRLMNHQLTKFNRN
jgi:hypothetical protein